MREIKFRSWDKNTQTMVMGYANNDLSDGGIRIAQFHYSSKVYMAEWILMQYTGLKDKNGKEIYEGDILELINEEGDIIRPVVEWGIHRRAIAGGVSVDIPAFCFRVYDRATFPIVENYAGKHDLDMIEVIGNIHEHKHLLNTPL